MLIVKGLPRAFGGVPVSAPVLGARLAHDGRPVALKVGIGVPVACTVKLPGCVAVKTVLPRW